MLADLRLAARTLWRHPGSTALTVAVLALGIGLTTATFSIVDGILWRPLDFPQSEEVVVIVEEGHKSSLAWLSAEDSRFLLENQTSYDTLAAHVTFYNLVTPEAGASQSYVSAYVTANFLELLQVEPVLGRGFVWEDEEPGAPPTAMLSYRAWQNHFGGDPAIAGRSFLIRRQQTTVIGVLPEGVHFPYRHDLWLAMPWHLAAEYGWALNVVGRLADDVTLRQARTELEHLAAQLDAARPLRERTRQWQPAPYVSATTEASYRDSLHLLWVAALGVLLIACTNVGSLRIAQTLERGGELGLRRALGAGRARLVSLLLAETTLMLVVGAAFGLLLAQGTVVLFRTQILPSIGMLAYWIDARLDPRSLAVAIGAAAFAMLVGGLLPAAGAVTGRRSCVSLASVGRSGSDETTPKRIGLRRTLVVAEVGLAGALLLSSGLMVKSVWKLQRVDAGMQTEGILTGLLSLYHLGFDEEDPVAARAAFFDRLVGALRQRPEVEAAAVGTAIPGHWRGGRIGLAADRRSRELEEVPRVLLASVSRGYFEVLGMTLLRGTSFLESEPRGQATGVVVNRSLVERHLENREAVGASLYLQVGEDWTEATIVGVVADVLTSGLDLGTPVIYVPLGPTTSSSTFVLVRAKGDPASLAPVLREEVARADHRVSVHEVVPLTVVTARHTWTQRVLRTLLSVFAVVALLLAAVGLYGVMTFTVERRSHEFGVRAALGAGAWDLRRMVLAEGMAQIAMGLVAGLALAAIFTRTIAAFLYGVELWDLRIVVGVIAGLGLAGLLASFVPATRAARADPATLLRSD